MIKLVYGPTSWVGLHLQLLVLEHHLYKLIVLVEENVKRMLIHMFMGFQVLTNLNFCGSVLGKVFNRCRIFVSSVPLIILFGSSFEYWASLNLTQTLGSSFLILLVLL